MSAVATADRVPAVKAESASPLRVLTVTTLYPNDADPRHGVFVETRLRQLRQKYPIDLRVIAPVPWFPVRWKIAGRYARYAATPRAEERFGIEVLHPRFLALPRLGVWLHPTTLARAAHRCAQRLRDSGWDFELIDAHYLYPDGVAAGALARELGRPFVVTARGSDVNFIAQSPGLRRRILESLEHARGIIAVSQSLRRSLASLGVPEHRIEVLRNGVDTQLFQPKARQKLRDALGIGSEEVLIASVGNLVSLKGHDLVLEAAKRLTNAHVVLVGRGPDSTRLRSLATALKIADQVHFFDNLPQADLPYIYSAADVLALGSMREGWPNVLLEAMACGTPVVATDAGAAREIVTNERVGEVVSLRTPDAFAKALQRVSKGCKDREAIREHAARFSWHPVVARYYEILNAATVAR